MKAKAIIPALLSALTLLAATGRADTPPDWVRARLDASLSEYDKSVPFVVLLDERVTTVKEGGRTEIRSRFIARVLTQEGRVASRREIQYDSQTRISDLHAWHIRADQKVFELGSDKVAEESIADDLYSDVRSKVMRFGEVEIGSVVAFEWVQKEKPLVNQDYHLFQGRAPVITGRYQLNLPEGWNVESKVFNHPPVTPVVAGNSYTWVFEKLPAIKEEALMPESISLSPFLAVSYYPSLGRATGKSFSSWQDVSRWADQIMQKPSRDPGAVQVKTMELVRGSRSDDERVRTLARWVQSSIRYASIQLGAIGGYRPNPPDVVLKKGYGDCKDKTALLQAMLRVIGIQSYQALVFSGDPLRVRPEFASPLQFNHSVIAIETKSEGPCAIDHPRLGRLLFFDPTDNITPLGDLPFYLQGSYGLIVKGGSGDLVRLPELTEKDNSLRREIAVQVEAAGGIVATVKETFSGQLASIARRRIAATGADEYVKEMSSRIARDIPGARIGELRINREADPVEPLRLEYRVSAQNYANRMDRLLVIRPVLLWVQQFPVFTEAERVHPIQFEMKSTRQDIIGISLPEGFSPDHVPSNIAIQCRIGTFEMSYQVKERELLLTRRLSITAQNAPASDYADVKRFFDAAQSASQSSIVLVGQ
jgi:transglutaminase-like putative cysteine protease